MSQSKLTVITCSRRKARENLRERVTIRFDFTSDWMKNIGESFSGNREAYSKCKTNYFSTLNWKPYTYEIMIIQITIERHSGSC